jgi:hypothetical protein
MAATSNLSSTITPLSNPAKGAAFEEEAQRCLAASGIQTERPFRWPIGHPAKAHNFDLGSVPPGLSPRVAVECKSYSWTAAGNAPAAKLTALREAVLYLSLLPTDFRAMIAMARDVRSGESLADYFGRLNGHLLGRIELVEIHNDAARWITTGTGDRAG